MGTWGGDGQRLLGSFALLLWCRQLLLQVLQLVLVLQQVPGLQLVDVQGQILTQDLDLKLQVELQQKSRGVVTVPDGTLPSQPLPRPTGTS